MADNWSFESYSPNVWCATSIDQVQVPKLEQAIELYRPKSLQGRLNLSRFKNCRYRDPPSGEFCRRDHDAPIG
jgi:hypothetical protein